MRKGDFPFVGDPIRISVDGEVLDGQQRLRAILAAGVTLEFVVISGLPPETQRYMDQGRKRSASDQLTIEGVTESALKASIARLLMEWDRSSILNRRFRASNAEVVRFVLDERTAMDDAARQGKRVYREVPIPTRVVGAVYYKMTQVNKGMGIEFTDRLTAGVDLGPGDPILALRRLVLRHDREGLKISIAEHLYYLTTTWQRWLASDQVARLQTPRGGVTMDDIPLIFDCGRTSDEDDT